MDMKTYKTGMMSNVIELQAENKDEAICVCILYFQSNAPIAVYDCEEVSTLTFPYDYGKVDKILLGMGERLKESYKSIKNLTK